MNSETACESFRRGRLGTAVSLADCAKMRVKSVKQPSESSQFLLALDRKPSTSRHFQPKRDVGGLAEDATNRCRLPTATVPWSALWSLSDSKDGLT
eukprot:4223776-Alexandrium_andersonii.AAC.1